MGWRGTVRSLAAAGRAIERDNQRRQKEQLRQQLFAASSEAVDAWERHIAELISIHVDLADAIDWQSLAAKPKPNPPSYSDKQEERARENFQRFKPGLFDFFAGGSNKKRAKLEEDVVRAKKKDVDSFEDAKSKYETELSEWESDTQLARRLLSGDETAYIDVIKEFQSFSDQGLIGSGIRFLVDEGVVHAIPEVHGEDIVPDFRNKQLASGKLSQTKMPIGQFKELYQDYVASVALKVAGDLFHILPTDEVYVTCVSNMLDSSTGHQKLTAILSVQFVRETFVRLNLEAIDPSDSMANFNHSMNFKKTKGFSPVDPLRPIGS